MCLCCATKKVEGSVTEPFFKFLVAALHAWNRLMTEFKLTLHSCFYNKLYFCNYSECLNVSFVKNSLIVGLLDNVCVCFCPRIAVLNIRSPVMLLLQTVRSHMSLSPHCRVKVQQQYHPLITVVQPRLLFMVHQCLGLFTRWQGTIAFFYSRHVWKVHWQLMVQLYSQKLQSLQIAWAEMARTTSRWILHHRRHYLEIKTHLSGGRMPRNWVILQELVFRIFRFFSSIYLLDLPNISTHCCGFYFFLYNITLITSDLNFFKFLTLVHYQFFYIFLH